MRGKELPAYAYGCFFGVAFEAMCVGDEKGLVRVNKAFLDMTGHRPDEAPFSYEQLTHPVDLVLFTTALNAETSDFEARLYTTGGKVLHMRWKTFRCADLPPSHFCAVAIDITEKKFIENQLGKYVIDLNRSKEEAQQFAYVASHDLQEPLRTISNYAGFLKEDYGHLLPPEGQEFVDYLIEGAKRGRALVNDLLSLSRVGKDSRFELVDMNAVVDDAVTGLEFRVQDTQATVLRGELPKVWGDASMLRLLLHNLISNGIKFHKKDVSPVVEICGEELENGWHFWVEDNGIGIDPKYADQVFVIFKRLDRITPGTGIGLAICKKVVERHGGSIWVESRLDKGATVHFSLAAREKDGAEHQTAHFAGRGPSAGCGSSSPGPRLISHTSDSSCSEGRRGCVHILASGGTLRERPSARFSLGRSEPT